LEIYYRANGSTSTFSSTMNAIRRDVHWKHYSAGQYPDGEFPELHKIHTDHCLYIVLQDLMCHATADLITTPWVDGQLNPFPDFKINVATSRGFLSGMRQRPPRIWRDKVRGTAAARGRGPGSNVGGVSSKIRHGPRICLLLSMPMITRVRWAW
jgi:hypothetical protein